MLRVTRSSFCKLVAKLLIVALVAPMFLWAGAGTARGQMWPTRRPISVVLLEIQDITPLKEGEQRDTYLADTLKAAIWTQLHENRWFQPVPENDLQLELQDTEHYQKPYNIAEQLRLAERLQAHGVITGFVEYLGKDPEKPVVGLRVQAIMLDKLTEEYVLGATVTVYSDPQPGADERTLLNDAIKKAAAELVTKMADYKVPEGVVLLASKLTAVKINIGETSGLKEGQRLALMRLMYDRVRERAELVKMGILRAYEVQRDSALCEVETAPSGVQVGDRVRAIWYEKPIGPTPPDLVAPMGAAGKKKHIGKVLTAAALFYLIATLILSNRATEEPRIRALEATDPAVAGAEYRAPEPVDARLGPQGKLRGALFSWHAVPGASEYRLELCPDRSFARDKTLRLSLAPRFPAGRGIEQAVVDRADADLFLAGQRTVWWRVGVRSDNEAIVRQYGPQFLYSEPQELVLGEN